MENIANYFPVTTFGEISQRSIFRPELVLAEVSPDSDLRAGTLTRCALKRGDHIEYIDVQVTHDITAAYAQKILERSPLIDRAFFVNRVDNPKPDDLVIQVTNTRRQYGDVMERLRSYDANFAPSWLPFSASCFIVGNNPTTKTVYCAVLDEKSPWGQSDVTPASRDAIAYQVAQHYGAGYRIVIVARRARCDLPDSMSLLPLETLPPVAQPSVNKPAEGMTWEPLTDDGDIRGARSAHGVPLRITPSDDEGSLCLDAWTSQGWVRVATALRSDLVVTDDAEINSLFAGYLSLF